MLKQLPSPISSAPGRKTPKALHSINWLVVSPDHQIVIVSQAAGHVHVLRDGPEWVIRLVSPTTGHRDIGRTPDAATARAFAELYVRASKPDQRLTDATAPWRALPMADTQRLRLERVGIQLDPDSPLTAGEASNMFQLAVALLAFKSATENQS